MTASSLLFESFPLKGLTLKNRITMAPLYLGYANQDGTVSPLLLDHYREMAASGVALVVVENAAVDPSGRGSPWTLRVDEDRGLAGLTELARTIHDQGALAFLQLNHAGRFAFLPQRLAPSPVSSGGVVPQEMSPADIERMVRAYAAAAGRVRAAGFDGVEIHGGTGYLIVQFLSARTNHRKDEYGGPLKSRMRFALEVVEAVMSAVGADFPVGYRFLADELLPEGLHPEETSVLAAELARRGLAYLSVMAGTHDSFVRPEYAQMEKEEAYMAHFAGEIKKAVPKSPIIAAGRLQSPETAEQILKEKTADLIGLARVLLADPLWPQKAEGKVSEPIVPCEPACWLCQKRLVLGRPAYCSQWPRERREAFRARLGEEPEEKEPAET